MVRIMHIEIFILIYIQYHWTKKNVSKQSREGTVMRLKTPEDRLG